MLSFSGSKYIHGIYQAVESKTRFSHREQRYDMLKSRQDDLMTRKHLKSIKKNGLKIEIQEVPQSRWGKPR